MLASFTTWVPIDKGWSADRKYQVTDRGGNRHLVRISPLEKYGMRKQLYELLLQLEDVPMCMPEGFGTCEQGVYTVFSWIDGIDAEAVLPDMPAQQAYALGVKAGKLLQRIHRLPAPADQEPWDTYFNRKMDTKLRKYRECPLRFAGDEHIIDFIRDNRKLLSARPQCFQHGDYHVGNFMLENGALKVIDFDRFDFGDPWEEFNRITWCAQSNPAFAAGRIDGYFDGQPPMEFFKLLALYISSNTLSSIYWAIPFGQQEVDVMMEQSRQVLQWYDNMQNVVPIWYRPYMK